MLAAAGYIKWLAYEYYIKYRLIEPSLCCYACQAFHQHDEADLLLEILNQFWSNGSLILHKSKQSMACQHLQLMLQQKNVLFNPLLTIVLLCFWFRPFSSPPLRSLGCSRGVSHLLAAFLCDSHSEHPLQDMLRASRALQCVHLAGLCQQRPQPDYLHHLQHRVQTSLHQDPQLLRETSAAGNWKWKWGRATTRGAFGKRWPEMRTGHGQEKKTRFVSCRSFTVAARWSMKKTLWYAINANKWGFLLQNRLLFLNRAGTVAPFEQYYSSNKTQILTCVQSYW